MCGSGEDPKITYLNLFRLFVGTKVPVTVLFGYWNFLFHLFITPFVTLSDSFFFHFVTSLCVVSRTVLLIRSICGFLCHSMLLIVQPLTTSFGPNLFLEPKFVVTNWVTIPRSLCILVRLLRYSCLSYSRIPLPSSCSFVRAVVSV